MLERSEHGSRREETVVAQRKRGERRGEKGPLKRVQEQYKKRIEGGGNGRGSHSHLRGWTSKER